MNSMTRSIRNAFGRIGPVRIAYRRYVYPLLKQSEPEIHLVRKMRFRTAIDVGANVGVYSVELGRISDAVLSFEPLRDVCQKLRSVVYPNTEVYNIALGESGYEAAIHTPVFDGVPEYGCASLSNPWTGSPVESERIVVRTLDEVLAERATEADVDFVKIDVEGFELKVLSGMDRTIRRTRPMFLIEIEARHNPRYAECFRLMYDYGYRSFYTPDGVLLQQCGVEDVATFQSEENFRCDISPVFRTFRRGERKSYTNNFFFLVHEADRTHWRSPMTVRHAPDDELVS